MALSNDLLSQFAKITNDGNNKQTETTVYGRIVVSDGKKYVRLDGSNMDTPISSTTDAKDGDRVMVMIKDHTAIVTGNLSAPSARQETVDGLEENLGGQITKLDMVVANKIDVDQLNAESARIEQLVVTGDAQIRGELSAEAASIRDLVASKASVEDLEATNAAIDNLDATYATIDVLEANYATINDLDAINVDVRTITGDFAEFKDTTTDKLTAHDAFIESADVKYANIDFSNINQAAIEKVFSESGIIRDLVVDNGNITGELVGVTIKGDLIEGNTIKADKLVVKGSDGLYYKLNFESGNFGSAEEVPTDGLHGSVIIANSITAEKIKVSDLVAFGATIGGFHITNSSLYSGVKESATNTTRGVYLDKDGQFSVGDSSNYLRYYKDSSGNYKLEITAKSLRLGSSGKSVEDIANDAEAAVGKVEELENRVNSGEFKGEDAVLLRIESSRGTVFKNDSVATILSVVIYRGSERIINSEGLRTAFGSGAYLQWKWQRLDDDTFGVISSSDSRFGDNGFTFTLSPSDVDTKVTFMCELII